MKTCVVQSYDSGLTVEVTLLCQMQPHLSFPIRMLCYTHYSTYHAMLLCHHHVTISFAHIHQCSNHIGLEYIAFPQPRIYAIPSMCIVEPVSNQHSAASKSRTPGSMLMLLIANKYQLQEIFYPTTFSHAVLDEQSQPQLTPQRRRVSRLRKPD